MLMCFTLVGCNSQNSITNEDNLNNNEVNDTTYGSEWPTDSIVDGVPAIENATITYYLSDNSISIYVDGLTGEDVENYMELLTESEFNTDMNEDNSSTYFNGKNSDGKEITVSYSDEELTIYIIK